MEIAGGETGKLIVVHGGSVLNRRGEGNNAAYERIKAVLAKNEIEITRVTPLVSANMLMGYAIRTDVPAYEVLDAYRR